ncbi:hypothetical protein N0V88_002437 [Collariella sp. IMI 366227]|nr:hypothetical protein N0V88_002437 [Collariella sp. IMI 366227]
MSGNSWLARQRKSELIELAQAVGVKDHEGMRKSDLELAIDEVLTEHTAHYQSDPRFQDYFKSRARASGSPLKRELAAVPVSRRRTIKAVEEAIPSDRHPGRAMALAQRLQLPASPADVAQAVDRGTVAVREHITTLYHDSGLTDAAHTARDALSTVHSVAVAVALFEMYKLRQEVLPDRYAFTTRRGNSPLINSTPSFTHNHESQPVSHAFATKLGDAYFLTSGDKIRFFLEDDAFSPEGELTKPKHLAVNKIGHYLHGLSSPFAALLSNSAEDSRGYVEGMKARPAEVAKALGFADPRVLQSMVICKQPEIGGAVPPHQDSTFLYTDPPSAVGFWYALEDATLENGCLSFLPGSHRWAPVERRLVRKAGDEGTEMVKNEGARFPQKEGYGEDKRPEGEEGEKYVAGEVKAGSLVLIHGNLLHKSERNLSQKGRIIYTFHVIEGGEGFKYDAKNWLQPPEEGFTKLYA